MSDASDSTSTAGAVVDMQGTGRASLQRTLMTQLVPLESAETMFSPPRTSSLASCGRKRQHTFTLDADAISGLRAFLLLTGRPRKNSPLLPPVGGLPLLPPKPTGLFEWKGGGGERDRGADAGRRQRESRERERARERERESVFVCGWPGVNRWRKSWWGI